jgi:MFS family permease
MLFSGAVAACIYVSYGFVTNLTLIVILGVVEGIAIVFQQPISQSLLADASPRDARGRVQGIAGMLSAIVGAVASFASLPLYHLARAIPFVGAGVTMVLGSSIAAFAIAIFTRRRVQDAQVRAPAPTGTDA